MKRRVRKLSATGRSPLPSLSWLLQPHGEVASCGESLLGERRGKAGELPARESAWMDDDKAVMLLPDSGVVAHNGLEIGAVVGNEDTLLKLGCGEEIGIAESAKSWIGGSRDDVEAAFAKAVGDLAADLLVE